jgi:hypothetical protein
LYVLLSRQPCRKMCKLDVPCQTGSHEVEGSNPSRSTNLILC